MEERDPPSRHLSPNPNHDQFEAGTYIVQVPKDQVFRSQMNENRGRRILPNPPQLPDTPGRPICCACTAATCLYGVIILVVLIAGVCGGILLLGRDDPILQVAMLNYDPKPPGPRFNIRVAVRNPNKYRSISYAKDSSYKVYLLYRKNEIATGEFPALDRQAPGNTTAFDIAMKGASNLPEEITVKKSTSRIPLTLTIGAGLESKVSGLKRIRVQCGLVVNELDKDTQILWQRCRSTN